MIVLFENAYQASVNDNLEKAKGKYVKPVEEVGMHSKTISGQVSKGYDVQSVFLSNSKGGSWLTLRMSNATDAMSTGHLVTANLQWKSQKSFSIFTGYS